jgi:hypothetical protein
MPLDFTGLSSLRWDGLNGKRIWFNATTIAGEYTTPTNSQWRKTPIPVIDVSSINQSESSLSPCTDSRAELFLFVEHSTAHDIWGGLYVCVCVCVCVCCRRRTTAPMARLQTRAFQRSARSAELQVLAARTATAPVRAHRQCLPRTVSHLWWGCAETTCIDLTLRARDRQTLGNDVPVLRRV